MLKQTPLLDVNFFNFFYLLYDLRWHVMRIARPCQTGPRSPNMFYSSAPYLEKQQSEGSSDPH